MVLFIQIIALLLWIGWIIGSVLPVLPWPLLSLVWIFLLQWFTPQDRSTSFLIIMTLLTVFTMVSDHLLPLVGTKKYGWSKAGIWWWTLGTIIWFFFFPPLWLVVWPLVGAFLGERWQKKDKQHARRAARWSFVGSGFSLLIKLVVSILHTRYIMQAIR